jgi:purine-binding chemotaxis protein CheW
MSDFYDEYDDEELEEDSQKNKYITFKLGNEEYGLEIHYVNEIIGIIEITFLPDMPDFIKGVINLRGNVIPIIDVRKRFKMAAIQYSDRACIIVVDFNELRIGLMVDAVSEVLNIPEENIEQTPKSAKIFSNKFIKGIGKVNDQVKIILNVEQILTDDEIEKMMVIN